ncbi:MAG TPA: 16S rRNA (adenine(1518)-N(6)/adenine(1519)-N(6))-dimethyltransferase RsmA [Candidatus Kapabacteria bacterium]|nr:16S rRNA (adenine(1518)-N(6)/adenine(1519)-N(6))-dimethyltransferase RsmA [Candidatus Kapabacteria bacterium]
MPQLQAKKSLGQHFLVDENILRRIAEATDIRQGESVIEIGPGTGLLTKHLLQQPLSKLTAFEFDERAIDILQHEFTDERFSVIHKDFLKVELSDLRALGKLNVIGNIPYYITTPIVFKLLEERANIRCATLLMQLEVAERLIGVPRTKEYGIPSVISQCFSEVKLLFKVKAGAFRPAPKVDSAVVRFDFENDYFQRSNTTAPERFDEKQFSILVRTLFAMRRKTIRNNLKQLQSTNTDSPALADFLPRRAEELTVKEFLELYHLLY